MNTNQNSVILNEAQHSEESLQKAKYFNTVDVKSPLGKLAKIDYLFQANKPELAKTLLKSVCMLSSSCNNSSISVWWWYIALGFNIYL